MFLERFYARVLPFITFFYVLTLKILQKFKYALRAQQKGLELVCHIPPQIPDALVGDPGRLRQIVVNLAGNAIKFTEQGEVVVHVFGIANRR